MMSEPSREHVEAVARHLHDVTCAFCDADGFACGAPREGDGHDLMAHVLLTSSDPAMLDAMQDALVRAGRDPWAALARVEALADDEKRHTIMRGFVNESHVSVTDLRAALEGGDDE